MKTHMTTLLSSAMSGFLFSCQTMSLEQLNQLTPAECRAYGVQVNDKDTISGTIVAMKGGGFAHLEKWCTGGVDHGRLWHGCARAYGISPPTPIADDHLYALYYAEHKCVPQHEACHAIYEAPLDTMSFSRRIMQGNLLAACP